MRRLLARLNGPGHEPPLLAAGLGHPCFVTAYSFDDGIGRIARAIGDLLLALADGSPQRFRSLSAQIQQERKAYHDILERTQKGTMDVTEWLVWFLATLRRAVGQAHRTLDTVLAKAPFWHHWAATPMNARQVKLINRLLDGFGGKLASSKRVNIGKCSADTALRDIGDLLERGVLRKSAAGARSTSYELNVLPEPTEPNPDSRMDRTPEKNRASRRTPELLRQLPGEPGSAPGLDQKR